jgi:hypothetical protein
MVGKGIGKEGMILSMKVSQVKIYTIHFLSLLILILNIIFSRVMILS